MEWEAHAMPITLVLQPTILHSIFFFISLKIQQKNIIWTIPKRPERKMWCSTWPKIHQAHNPQAGGRGATTSGWILDLWPNIKRTNS
jgi:hypothetical protein